MFLPACLLGLLPGAAFVQHPVALAPTADGKLLFVAMGTGVKDNNWVCVWDLAKPELRATVPGIPENVTAVRPTADGKRFVLVAGDEFRVGRVEVWDTAAKKRLHAFEVSPRDVGQAVVSPDGAWVAYSTWAGKPKAPRVTAVWNTATGEPAAKAEKAVADVAGTVTFTPDGKHLVVASPAGYAEFDPATGGKGKSWAGPGGVGEFGYDFGIWSAALPGGRGVVSVAGTAKRRQSYVVRLLTEKKDHFLGEVWDRATPPTVSPDGRLLVVSGGRLRADGGGTFALKLDADGAPELTDKAPKVPFRPARLPGGREEKEFPAWRPWGVEEPTRGDPELPKAMAFSPDGRRLFVAGRLGTVHVFDAERRGPTATLFCAWPGKENEFPGWYILTAAGEVVGSEAEALVKGGKVRDPAKVREALGVK